MNTSDIVRDIIDRVRAKGVSPERDAEARAQQTELARERLRAFYLQRCSARGVPRGADIRCWVFPDEVRGESFDLVERALASRGHAREGRWSIVVMLGAAGTGKTSAIARATARHRHDALYALAPDVAAAFDSRLRSFDHDRQTQSYVGTLVTVDLLAIDEVGTEPEALSGVIENLVVRRCTDGLVTVLAGNLTAEAFAARYRDQRMESRLDADGGHLVMLSGEDLRRPR